MRYAITAVQRSWEETTIIVEADSPEEAEKLASAKIEAGEVEWRFLETSDDNCLEITGVNAA